MGQSHVWASKKDSPGQKKRTSKMSLTLNQLGGAIAKKDVMMPRCEGKMKKGEEQSTKHPRR